MHKPTIKRRSQDDDDGPRKAPKLASAGGGGTAKMSLAQKMMAKMGYKEGSGIGKDGTGMLDPIEVKLRPQGSGIGTIREKTDQYKKEQRRAAEMRGETYEGSSGEERRARKAKKSGDRNVKTRVATGIPKSKTRYKTLADIQAAAPGLEVPPQMLSSIIDATGSQTRLLTSAAGLMTSTGNIQDTEAEKISKRERVELEALLDAWHGLQERKIYIEERSGQLQTSLENHKDKMAELQSVMEAVTELKDTDVGVSGAYGATPMNRWAGLIKRVEKFQEDHGRSIAKMGLSDAVVGAICSAFKEQMMDWDPINEPDFLVVDLGRIGLALGLRGENNTLTRNDEEDFGRERAIRRRAKSTTSYETLLYTIWLPKIRTAMAGWNVLDHSPMTTLVQSWKPLLPDFIQSHLIDQLIVPKLETALHTWDPRKRAHHHKQESLRYAQPHTWIFPWLPYLPSYQLDLKTSGGLLTTLKLRMGQVLDGWSIASGVLSGLLEWRVLLHSELDHIFVGHLLKKLSYHLAQEFKIDPSDQVMTPLEDVFRWMDHFKPETYALLLIQRLFPLWHYTLHGWLTSGFANLQEVGQWYLWWRNQIPNTLSVHPGVTKEFSKGMEMIHDAIDLQEQGVSLKELPAPAAGPARPVTKEASRRLGAQAKATAQRQRGTLQDKAPGFREIIEEYCADENLTMMPLREVHTGSGQPLYRVYSGGKDKRGVVIYLHNDSIFAQKKGDRSTFEQIGFHKLVDRIEDR